MDLAQQVYSGSFSGQKLAMWFAIAKANQLVGFFLFTHIEAELNKEKAIFPIFESTIYTMYAQIDFWRLISVVYNAYTYVAIIRLNWAREES